MHVHFIAIAGTGMGSLAGLLKTQGHEVTGSDEAVYPPMSTALERWGIPVAEGFRAEHVESRRPDLVVIGNAVRPENPEARAALDGGLRCLSFPDALYEYAIAGRHSVVVSGTHGKTTTSALIATLLHETGQDPSFLVGGILANFDGSYREGGGAAFVVEGDEYDTAFFDKTPKFLHYHPQTLVLTSVEFDHADIYRDLEHVKSAFRTLVEQMPSDGVIVAATAEPNVADVLTGAPCRVVGYAVEPGAAEWCATALEPGATGTAFSLSQEGAAPLRVFTPMSGRHNVANSLAALLVSRELGVPIEEAVSALERFRGVKRRMEVRGEAAGVTVMDDFAHHPTAVRETLAGLRATHPGRRIVAVFEPRSNTTRRTVFQRDYARAFGGADRVIVSVVPEAPIYSATGEVTEWFSAGQLAEDLAGEGKDAVAIDGVAAIVESLVADAREGDIVITLSNGGFGGIWDLLLAGLEARA
ncbi:MAG: UDP-N-acetylmuramate:L-alanyl-gamma-D-glutamyl-meso-diaminopimelate ligase [Myxococcota bacterium]